MTSSKLQEPVGAQGHQERRGSVRIPLTRQCPYEISEFPAEGNAELRQGLTLSLNVSTGGMLLLMPWAPMERQVFNVQAPLLTSDQRRNEVVEVRWTRELPLGTGAYVVGVKFLLEVHSSDGAIQESPAAGG